MTDHESHQQVLERPAAGHAPEAGAYEAGRDEERRPRLFGLLAEFADVDSVSRAAERVRDLGYRRWDVHSPFPIHGIDQAMGTRMTKLPWVVFLGGITGTTVGLGLVWFTNAFDYQFLVSGKPVFSLQANVPVIFETTVLLAALSAVFGMLLMNKLPMLYNPLFKHRRFRRVTNDRFFIVMRADDPRFHRDKAAELLRSVGAESVEEVED